MAYREYPKASTELASAFWKRVAVGGPDECWPWKLGTTGVGGVRYGRFWFDKNAYAAHRIAYSLANESPDVNLQVCHSCDNGLCCNPSHLWLGTSLENNRDKSKKGRHRWPLGENTYNHKLTALAVRVMRRLHGRIPQNEMADIWGVSRATVCFAISGKRWGHIG